jgi:hypothetical protein
VRDERCLQGCLFAKIQREQEFDFHEKSRELAANRDIN